MMVNKVHVGLTFASVSEILRSEIQIKVTDQNFPVVLFTILYKVVKLLSLKMKSVTIQMKANEQYFPVVLFINLHKV